MEGEEKKDTEFEARCNRTLPNPNEFFIQDNTKPSFQSAEPLVPQQAQNDEEMAVEDDASGVEEVG